MRINFLTVLIILIALLSVGMVFSFARISHHDFFAPERPMVPMWWARTYYYG